MYRSLHKTHVMRYVQAHQQTHVENGMPHWSNELRGGMPRGPQVTDRKTQQRQDSHSLAQALGSFLSNWENKQGSMLRTNQETWDEDAPVKKKREGAQSKPSEGPQDGQLLQDLISWLQQCQSKKMTDRQVADGLSAKLQHWSQPARWTESSLGKQSDNGKGKGASGLKATVK